MINKYEILRRLGHLPFLQSRKKSAGKIQDPSGGEPNVPNPALNQSQEFEPDFDMGFCLYDFEAAEKGTAPNYAKLRRDASAVMDRNSSQQILPSKSHLNVDWIAQANENYRREREAFVRARAAGKMSIDDITDWGTRMRMIASDRAAARTRAALQLKQGM